jgi:hypothetical protein
VDADYFAAGCLGDLGALVSVLVPNAEGRRRATNIRFASSSGPDSWVEAKAQLLARALGTKLLKLKDRAAVDFHALLNELFESFGQLLAWKGALRSRDARRHSPLHFMDTRAIEMHAHGVEQTKNGSVWRGLHRKTGSEAESIRESKGILGLLLQCRIVVHICRRSNTIRNLQSQLWSQKSQFLNLGHCGITL